MNPYVVLAIVVIIAVSACVCVFFAYRRGLKDGLDVSKTNRLKETVVVKKKTAAALDDIKDVSMAKQYQNLADF